MDRYKAPIQYFVNDFESILHVNLMVDLNQIIDNVILSVIPRVSIKSSWVVFLHSFLEIPSRSSDQPAPYKLSYWHVHVNSRSKTKASSQQHHPSC